MHYILSTNMLTAATISSVLQHVLWLWWRLRFTCELQWGGVLRLGNKIRYCWKPGGPFKQSVRLSGGRKCPCQRIWKTKLHGVLSLSTHPVHGLAVGVGATYHPAL